MEGTFQRDLTSGGGGGGPSRGVSTPVGRRGEGGRVELLDAAGQRQRRRGLLRRLLLYLESLEIPGQILLLLLLLLLLRSVVHVRDQLGALHEINATVYSLFIDNYQCCHGEPHR